MNSVMPSTLPLPTSSAVMAKNEAFGNARFARNLFEQSINRQAVRLAEAGVAALDADAVSTVTADDVAQAARLLSAQPPPA